MSRGERPRPRVVALGGGHGLSSTLRAVKRYAPTITAVVSAADDGGSSGKLRDAFGIPPPGDLRKCLVALSDPASVWARTFEHRFEAGELEGHALGNLVIAGLASTCGSFTAALEEAGRVVGAAGRVLPATVDPVVLKAEVEDGYVEGQVAVARTGRISRVSLVPPDAEPPPEALEALAEADQVVIGPGSLYTSVLAALVVPALRDAVASTPGRKVYVCNLRTQEPETAGYDVARHVAALSTHGVEVDVVLYDPGTIAPGTDDDRFVATPLSSPDGSGHDPARLAAALSDLVG